MTQIKLRRDTSANFASKNPVLGLGEPAYETDTKKLKIGDGTTAYTQLEYFSAGGGGSANIGATLPLKIVNGVISLEVDGQTIQVVDGKLAASANMVTTNTAQTITGVKKFTYGDYSFIINQAEGIAGIAQGTNSVNSKDTLQLNNSDVSAWAVGAKSKDGYIYATSLTRNDGNSNQVILDAGNLGSYVDGTTITYANNKLSTSVGGVEICDIGMALYVDETKGLRRYLNGQIIDINTNTQAFLNRLKEITTLHPSLLCTEEEWQTAKTMSAFGQVGKFVFNYSGENIVSVRLPRVVNVQGLFDLQNLGLTVGAGLPNMSLYTPNSNDKYGSQKNTIYNINSISGNSNNIIGTPYPDKLFIKDDNNIVGNSDTVQPEAIQYPYFIQIATGSETENNIVNTLENVNGFTLLESKYSDKPLYNECWLLSSGQQNAKAVYPTVYEGVQVEYNTGIEAGTTVTLPSGVSYTKRGLSVKLSTEEYTDYDFVINTADETFRLPLKTKLASGKAVVGNGMSLGLTNGDENNGIVSTNNNGVVNRKFAYGVNVGTNVTDTTGFLYNSRALGITTDPTKSGIELSDSGLYLYYYVGETVQNANLIDAGRIGEQLATKTDMLQASGAGMPSSRYIDLTLGANGTTYTAPANGWFSLKATSTAGRQGLMLENVTAGEITQIVISSDANQPLSTTIPVQKGQVIKCGYPVTPKQFRFIYAEGSK